MLAVSLRQVGQRRTALLATVLTLAARADAVYAGVAHGAVETVLSVIFATCADLQRCADWQGFFAAFARKPALAGPCLTSMASCGMVSMVLEEVLRRAGLAADAAGEGRLGLHAGHALPEAVSVLLRELGSREGVLDLLQFAGRAGLRKYFERVEITW